MSIFKPTADERETLKKAVTKFAHEPAKARMLFSLDLPEAEFAHGSEDWDALKHCAEHHFLHAQTELRRDPNKKQNKQILVKADALIRKFNPNFS